MSAQRYDRSVRLSRVDATPQGGLAAEANLTRIGVFTYTKADGSKVRELRHPNEVFDAARLAGPGDAVGKLYSLGDCTNGCHHCRRPSLNSHVATSQNVALAVRIIVEKYDDLTPGPWKARSGRALSLDEFRGYLIGRLSAGFAELSDAFVRALFDAPALDGI